MKPKINLKQIIEKQDTGVTKTLFDSLKTQRKCRFCESYKVYDTLFNKWLCPVCDNVRQS